MSLRSLSIEEVVDRALGGDRRAVGRLLSVVERGGPDAEIVEAITHGPGRDAHVIGITGAPGAGKSTMVARLVATITGAGGAPAVVAVDPSSPLTGGAILGDRVRMAEVDTSAFIRSVATRGHSGGLALSVPGSARVLGAAGFDPVIIETVGVGQVEVDVTAAADTTVVVVTPGMGDAVQANKAGLLEVADIFVVNKADLPGASDARRDLELMLELSHVTGQEDASRRPPILMVNSIEGDGIDAIRTAIAEHHDHLVTTDRLRDRRRARARYEMRSRAELAFASHLDHRLTDDAVEAAVDAVIAGTVTPSAAARELWQPDA